MGNLFSCVSIVLFACYLFETSLLGDAQFSSKNYEIEEDTGELELKFSLETGRSQATVVHFATMDGTAVSAVDFLSAGGTVELLPGTLDGSFSVSLVDDPLIDGAKEFSVRLFELNAAQEIVILDEAQVIIHDNEERLVLDPAYRNSEPGFIAMAVQADGRLLGVLNGQPVRLNLDGSRDAAFAAFFKTNPAEGTYETVSSITVQADGQVLLAGQRERFVGLDSSTVVWIRRYASDGTLDPTFEKTLARLYDVSSIVSEPAGDVVVSGRSTDVTSGRLQMKLVRVHSDGSTDRGFVTTNILPTESGIVDSLAVRNDGEVLIGGSFSIVYGQDIHALAQLKDDGSLDDSFQANLPPGSILHSMVLQSDGKLVYGAHDPEQGMYVARLRADGSRDPEFMVTDFGPTNGRMMELIWDEEQNYLYVAGNFRCVNGWIWHQLLRLEGSTGKPDFSFGDSEAFSDRSVRGLILLPNGGLHTDKGRVFTDAPSIRAVSFAEESTTILEDSSDSSVRIYRYGPSDEPLTVTLQHELEGLQSGRDFDPLPSELVFGPLQSNIRLPIRMRDNSFVDGNRKLRLSMTAKNKNDLTVSPSVWCASIADNEIPHSLLGHRFSILAQLRSPRLFPLNDGSFIVASEDNHGSLFRIHSDGTRDDRFHFEPLDADSYGVTIIRVQDDGHVLVGGWAVSGSQRSRPYLTRIDGRTGAVDAEWKKPDFSRRISSTSGEVSALEIDDSGGEPRIWVGGQFQRVNGESQPGLVRLNRDGSVDSDFDLGLEFQERYRGGDIFSILTLPAGEGVVLAGYFPELGGPGYENLVKVSWDGSAVTDYLHGQDLLAGLSQVQQDSEGRLLLSATTVDYESLILRLNLDGTLDDSFVPFPMSPVNTWFELLPDDRLLVFGSIEIPFGEPSLGLVRLGQDGRPDFGFRPIVQMDGLIRQVVPLGDERVLLLGDFQQMNHLPAPRVAEISLNALEESGAILFSDSDVLRILTEGDDEDSLVIPIKRFGPTTRSETVSIDIAGGNAKLEEDFVLSERRLVFGPGEVEKEIRLKVFNDGALESDETVELILRGSSSTGPNAQISVTLRDNEVPNTIDYSFKARVGEEIVPSVMEIADDGSIYVGGRRGASLDGIIDSNFRLRPDGSLDEGFKLGFELNGTISSITVMPGHLYVAGYFSYVEEGGYRLEHLARLHLDGSVDRSFDTGAGFDRNVNVLMPMADGSILVGGGFSRFNNRRIRRLVKLHSDGRLDLGFAADLGDNASLFSLGQQQDGSVIVCGRFFGLPDRDSASLIRLHSDGSLDSDWGPTLIGAVNQIQVASDDAIYISGIFESIDGWAQRGLARLQPDGRLDRTFVPDERLLSINKMRLIDDGQLIVAGRFDRAAGAADIVGLDSNGRIRDSFNSRLGRPRRPLRNLDFVVDSEGRLVVSGYASNEDEMVFSSIVRLSREPASGATIGFLQTNYQVFESEGGLEIELNRIGDIESPSRIQWTARGVAGESGKSRLEQEGFAVFESLDRRQTIRLDVLDDVLAESDEQVVITLDALSEGDTIGFADVDVRILDNDRVGSIDESFITDIRRLDRSFLVWDWTSSPSGFSDFRFSPGVGDVNQIFHRRGDQILIRGDFDFINDRAVENIAVLNSDGSVNTEFMAELNPVSLRWIEVQASGKILVLGRELDGRLLFRLNPDGSFDDTFASVFADDIEEITGFSLLGDDRILLWGSFSSFKGEDRSGLVLLSSDGVTDPSFQTGLRPRTALSQAVVLPDDRILIGGSLRLDGHSRPVFLAQLMSNGTLDPSFDLTSGPNRLVSSISPVDAEHIYLEGDFTRIGTEQQRHQGWIDSRGRPTDPIVSVKGNPDFRGVYHQLGERFFLPGQYEHDGEGILGLGVFQPEGSKDPLFEFGEAFQGEVHSLAFAPNGDVFLGGTISRLNGAELGGLVRLNGEYLFSIEEIVAHDDGTLSIWISSIPGENYVLESSVDMLNWVEVERQTAMEHRLGLRDDLRGERRLFRVRHLSPTP